MVMAEVSTDFNGQYFSRSFEHAVKIDILKDEESSYQLNSILCTSEEKLGSTKLYLTCEPKFAGSDIGSTILFEK
jgi:hypothetical protein